MSECTECKRSTGQARHKIVCYDCKSLCHATCVKLSKEDIDFIVAEKSIWRCPTCTQVRRKNMTTDNTDVLKTGDDINKVISMLEDAKNERKRLEEEMTKAFDFVHGKIDDQKSVIVGQTEKLNDFLQLVESLRSENFTLKKRVAELENKVEENEQYMRSNTLEIQGVPEPESKTEDVYEVVRKVGVALDMNIPREAIDICHRLGKRPNSDTPAGIIVKFVRREDKIKMLEKRRVKRNLSTQHLGYKQAAVPVYVNESLSPARRKLLAEARRLKREKGYTFLWVRNGKIFLRKKEGDPVTLISSLDQIKSM